MSPARYHSPREAMVHRQLRRRGIVDLRVLDAMGATPRELFVPHEQRGEAYADCALPIACGQTISQPYIVALMTEALRLTGRERVLEIGTGSGYQAAVLAALAAEVVTVERHAELSRQAAAQVARLGLVNVRFLVGDGTLGWPPEAPYDRILVTAASPAPPPALLQQLVDGGILVIPCGSNESQVLQAITRTGESQRIESLAPCRFVPLIGAQGFANG